MGQPEGKPPHAGERLTREDVERLITEHGGPEGLDLRGADLRQADLSQIDLHGAHLMQANLRDADLQEANLGSANLQESSLAGANLQGAYLVLANLEQADLLLANLQHAGLALANVQRGSLWLASVAGADLERADLREADLSEAQLQGANLDWAQLQAADLSEANLRKARFFLANLQGAHLAGADLRGARLAYAHLRDVSLEDAVWGRYVLGEEMEGDFSDAAAAYRGLKQAHAEAGMYDIAGEFHYREMDARRKLAWKERRLPYALTMYALRFLYGYGERPWRVIGWAAAVVFGLALVHWLFGTVAGGFLDALYYSAVSFPALGYGQWAPEPQGWAGRFLGAGESFLGVFMMALFLVTFTRKMTR